MKQAFLLSLFTFTFACPSLAVLSPGYGVGVTDYDWLRNGSMEKAVALDTLHGVHVYWTYRINGDQSSRRAYYNFKDESGAWIFGQTGISASGGYLSRMGSLGLLSDGRACVAGQGSDYIYDGTGVYINLDRGSGVFRFTLPVPIPVSPLWPGVAVGGNDVIHVIASSLGVDDHYYSRSTDYGQNWSPWTPLCSDGIGGGWFAMAAQGGKVALVYPESVAYTMRLRESTDGGVTWGAISMIDPGDTTNSRLFQDALYGPTGELHVVWDVVDTQSTKPPSASQIRHWSPSTGISVVRSGYWASASGSNINSVGCPSIGYNSRNNTFWCTWVEFTLADTGANGWSNGEVWAAYSNDNGRTWRGHRNITNSPTPGAPPGLCADDRYASLAAVVDDTLRVLYLSSFDAGSSAYEGSAITVDTMRYHQVPVDSFLGVESTPSPPVALTSMELRIVPNPARGHTVISFSFPYPLTPTPYTLSLYGLSGRRVKSFSPHALRLTPHEVVWDGRDDKGKPVSSGVYFVKLKAGSQTLTRRLVLTR